MNLKDKIAIVTGGSKRVGRALTLALAEAGCHVAIHYNHSVDPAQQTAAEARALGVNAAIIQADLTYVEEAVRLVEEVARQLGSAQILINSAAIFPEDTIMDVTIEAWSRTFRVNLRSPVFLTQAFVRHLPANERGAVINISDWRAERPYPDHFSYSVAKGALDAFTRAAAISLAPRVRVNAIALGPMLPPPGKGADYLEARAAQLPLRRAGGVDVIAQTMLFLLRNDFITGEIVRLDGGAHLKADV
ncbi:MAG: SDR family oxidoreductase [Chloroflexi bacterium]|nr:SDR family oxidoreductase [Chloroflexota bacterium]